MSRRRFITLLGYKALPWLQGTNSGSPAQLEAFLYRFYRLHHGFEMPISIVGHSLGGVYAREIAKEFPHAVRCVTSLGSPYRVTESGTTNPFVEKLFEKMSGVSVEEMRAQRPTDREAPLSMPATSVYTTHDGVVDWRTCMEPEDDNSENIRVHGSHSGLVMNADVFRIVADRLAQDPENWQPFDVNQGCRRMIYPHKHAPA